MPLRRSIVAVISLDILLSLTKCQRNNPQLSDKRIPFSIQITKTWPYILAAAYYETAISVQNGNTQVGMPVVQRSTAQRHSRSQRHRIQRQGRAAQYNRII